MTVKIHPGIGVARVGDSPHYFVGPETVDVPGVPSGGYRDEEGRIRRQAARFRIFDDATPVVAGPSVTIQWTVHLLGGVGTISGTDSVELVTAGGVTVAELRTDSEGNLLVLSQQLTATSSGCGDGPVEAAVTIGATSPPVVAAWVTLVPPDFAPGRLPPLPYHYLVLDWLVGQGLLAVPTAADSLSFRRDIHPAVRGRTALSPDDLLALTTPAERHAAVPNYIPPPGPSVGSVGPYLQAVLDRFYAGAFDDDWAIPTPLTPEELDRGPLSFTDGSCPGPGWELRLLPMAPGAIAPGERFRFNQASVAVGVTRPFTGWRGDLPLCFAEWVSVTDAPGSGFGGDWQLRGFMVGSLGSLTYEDWQSRFELLTTELHFGNVQRGSGVARPIEIELAGYYQEASIRFVTPLPDGVSVLRSVVSTGQVPEEGTTMQLWVFLRATLAEPLGPIPAESLQIEIDAQTFTIPITANIVPAETTQLALVLDCSASMDDDRGDGISKFVGLTNAVDVLISVARPGDGIAIAPFSDDELPTHTARSLGDGSATDTRREALHTFMSGQHTVNLTSIGDGILSARHLLTLSPDSFDHDALLVITDGVETAPEWIRNVTSSIREDTFAIGIGTSDNINTDILSQIAGSHNGYLLLTGDSVSGSNRYRLEKFLLQILAGATRDQVVLDPSGSVLPGEVVRIPIPVTEAEFRLDAVVVSDDASELVLALMGPDGAVRSFEALAAQPGVQVVRRQRVGMARLPTPLAMSDGHTWTSGTWYLLIAQRAHAPRDITGEAFSRYFKDGGTSSLGQRGKPISYAAVVNAQSALRLSAHAQATGIGKPFVIEATLDYAGIPLRSVPALSAQVQPPVGPSFDVTLTAAHPGRFLGEFQALRPGVYATRIRARGQSPAGSPFMRELTLTPALLAAPQRDDACDPCRRARHPREKVTDQLGVMACHPGFKRLLHSIIKACGKR